MKNGGINGLGAYINYYAGLWRYKIFQLKNWIARKWIKARFRKVFDRFDRVEQANRLANRAYIPKPFPGTVHLFHAVTQALYENNSPHNGWGDVGIENLIIIPLECYHGNILFEPFVSEVAVIVNKQLNAS